MWSESSQDRTSKKYPVWQISLQVLPVVCQWIAELQASLQHGGDTDIQIAGANVTARPSCGVFATCSGPPLSSIANSFRLVSASVSFAAAEEVGDQQSATGQTEARPSDPAEDTSSMQPAEAGGSMLTPSADPVANAALTERLLGHFGSQGACDGVLQLAKPLVAASVELCASAPCITTASGSGGQDLSGHHADLLLKVSAAASCYI